MATKKKPSIKIPLDDVIRNAIRAAGKKSRKLGKAVKKADDAAEMARYERFKAKRPSAAERAAKRGPSLSAETRQKGTSQMVREWDRRLKADEVNKRIASGDSALFGRREMEGRPVTKKQIRDAKGASKGLKKNLPKVAGRESKKSETQQIAEAAARRNKMEARKAAGGKNSAENIAKRQQKRAEMRKKNNKKK